MGGRCGNQMYRYAFARAHQVGDEPIVLDFRRVALHRRLGEPAYNDLKDFALCENVEMINEDEPFENDRTETVRLCRLYVDFCKKVGDDKEIDKFEKMLEPFFREHNIYERQEYYEYPQYIGDKYVLGLCNDPRYFEGIRELLMKDFTPKWPPLTQNKKLYEIINNTESICLSFRNWGMFGKEIAEKFEVCDQNYYDRAIEIMESLHPNCQYIVFSDDVEWVKDHFAVPANTVFEEENNPVWEKIRLMYSCKHYIIPNSTFAWWVQFLSRNEHRTVISPSKWSKHGKYSESTIAKNFITVPV